MDHRDTSLAWLSLCTKNKQGSQERKTRNSFAFSVFHSWMAARPLGSIPHRLFSLSRPFPRNALRNIVSATRPTSQPERPLRSIRPTPPETLAQKIGKSVRLPGAISKARVHADVNVARPKEYWDYETLTVQWGYDPFLP